MRGDPHGANFDADAASKSSAERPELDDLDRPLAPRGQEPVPLMAHDISQSKRQPDLVLCSPAARVCETWQLMTPVLDRPVDCKTLRTIYPSAPGRLLETLRRGARRGRDAGADRAKPGARPPRRKPMRNRTQEGARTYARQVPDGDPRRDRVRRGSLE